MTLGERIGAFVKLGEFFRRTGDPGGSTSGLSAEERAFFSSLDHIRALNPWFDTENIRFAIRALGIMLAKNALERWLANYPELNKPAPPKNIGVIMAGNIPLVGFHDLMSVLITGNRVIGKVSSRDGGLHAAVAGILTGIEPRFRESIRFSATHLTGVDALIATGSDNTARHVEWHYRDIPLLIRRNMNGLTILDGQESPQQLTGLADDIFCYFGLGCRSVSALFVPDKYDLSLLRTAFQSYKHLVHHPAYLHNLTYQRATMEMEKVPFTDGGNILFRPDIGLASPIGVLYIQTYKNRKTIENYITEMQERIQCLVADPDKWPEAVPFGRTQYPGPEDYADRKDTIRFILSGC